MPAQHLGGVLSATSASAAAPVFPDNLVVFPDRDVVTVEGFQDHVGETATLQVLRALVVRKGLPAAAVVAATTT